MERRVKERLVGAAVLMAAAVILIPEMLSGTRDDARAPQTSADTSLKTYTIDLNRSPGTTSAVPVEERMPPPEVELRPSETNPDSGSAVPSENSTREHEAFPEPAVAPSESQTRMASEIPPAAPAPQSPPVRESQVPRPIASAPDVPTSRGWAVQLGSFASRATADRMVKDLSGPGQSAFVMPVKSGSSTLYRVRIGPFGNRAAADAALREVKGRVANAAVVAHP